MNTRPKHNVYFFNFSIEPTTISLPKFFEKDKFFLSSFHIHISKVNKQGAQTPCSQHFFYVAYFLFFFVCYSLIL